MSDKEWDEMKDRRLELILKRAKDGLSPEEVEELRQLQELAASILITQ